MTTKPNDPTQPEAEPTYTVCTACNGTGSGKGDVTYCGRCGGDGTIEITPPEAQPRRDDELKPPNERLVSQHLVSSGGTYDMQAERQGERSESPAPTHEFVPCFNPEYCYVRVRGGFCGQPRSSPVHTEVPEPKSPLGNIRLLHQAVEGENVCTYCKLPMDQWLPGTSCHAREMREGARPPNASYAFPSPEGVSDPPEMQIAEMLRLRKELDPEAPDMIVLPSLPASEYGEPWASIAESIVEEIKPFITDEPHKRDYALERLAGRIEAELNLAVRVPAAQAVEGKHVFEPHDDDDNDSNFCRLCNKYRLDERYHVAAQGDVVDREMAAKIADGPRDYWQKLFDDSIDPETRQGVREYYDKAQIAGNIGKKIRALKFAQVVDRAAVIRECAEIAKENASKWRKYGEDSLSVFQGFYNGGVQSAEEIELSILALSTTPPAAKENDNANTTE